jgi:hypothetical protein
VHLVQAKTRKPIACLRRDYCEQIHVEKCGSCPVSISSAQRLRIIWTIPTQHGRQAIWFIYLTALQGCIVYTVSNEKYDNMRE